MSADNWGTCPVCKDKDDRKARAALAAAKAAYGNVPADQWQAQMAKAQKAVDALPNETLREDYESFIDDAGVLHIKYRAECLPLWCPCGLAGPAKAGA